MHLDEQEQAAGATPDGRQSIASQIRAALASSNLTNQQLAAMTGLHPGHLSRFRSGKRQGVGLETIEALARVLGAKLVFEPPAQVDPPAFE